MSNLIEAYLREQVQAMREAVPAESDQLRLGQLIAHLEAVDRPDEAEVYFDFGYLAPSCEPGRRQRYGHRGGAGPGLPSHPAHRVARDVSRCGRWMNDREVRGRHQGAGLKIAR